MGKLRVFASDAGFAVVVAATVLSLAATMAGLLPPGTLPVAAVYLHVWLTILDGGWTRLRRVTWLLLTLSWLGALAVGFLGYVLPWGQIGFWLMTGPASLPPIGQTLAEWMGSRPGGHVLSGAGGLLLVAPFVADVAVAAVLRLRGRPAWYLACVAVPAFAVLALVVLEALVMPPQTVPVAADDPLTPADIVPRWYMLPWYAMLRGPADKLLGVAVTAAAVLLPTAAPWMRAERFRSGVAGVAWPSLCLALLLDFVGLGWLGAQLPAGSVIVASQVLTVGWFAFFLLAAPLVARAGRCGEAGIPS